MIVNHQHLRAFHAVATELSFSRAARRLNISQPTLSQQIKSLEMRHGRMLFEGRRRPLRLTPLGRELLSLTGRMFDTAADIEDLLGPPPSSGGVVIRLVSDSPPYAAQLAQAMIQADGGCEIEVRIENAANTLACLLDARADVAIVSGPAIDARFAYQPLFVDRLMVALPSGHRLAEQDRFPLAALGAERLLIRELTSKTRGAMEALLAAHDICVERRMEVHSREAIREIVAIGMGMSMFFSAECPPDARLDYRIPDCDPDAGSITGHVVCCVDRQRSALMRSMFDIADRLAASSPVPLKTIDYNLGQSLKT